MIAISTFPTRAAPAYDAYLLEQRIFDEPTRRALIVAAYPSQGTMVMLSTSGNVREQLDGVFKEKMAAAQAAGIVPEERPNTFPVALLRTRMEKYLLDTKEHDHDYKEVALALVADGIVVPIEDGASIEDQLSDFCITTYQDVHLSESAWQ